MEVEITATQELVSSKKSVVLKPSNQGNAKVILVKHYISPCGKDENTLKAAFSDAPSKAIKRKSLLLAATKESSDQYASVKRRRSIQLGESKRTSTISAPEKQYFRVNRCWSQLGENNNERANSDEIHILHGQSEEDCQSNTKIGPSKEQGNNNNVDSQSDALLHVEWGDDGETILLPEEWSDRRYQDDLLDSRALKHSEHKALLSISDQESTRVENNTNCQSFFRTYCFSKVQKSIIDEV